MAEREGNLAPAVDLELLKLDLIWSTSICYGQRRETPSCVSEADVGPALARHLHCLRYDLSHHAFEVHNELITHAAVRSPYPDMTFKTDV